MSDTWQSSPSNINKHGITWHDTKVYEGTEVKDFKGLIINSNLKLDSHVF